MPSPADDSQMGTRIPGKGGNRRKGGGMFAYTALLRPRTSPPLFSQALLISIRPDAVSFRSMVSGRHILHAEALL